MRETKSAIIIVESYAYLRGKTCKDEKEEQFRASKRGEEKTYEVAYNGVEEIKVGSSEIEWRKGWQFSTWSISGNTE